MQIRGNDPLLPIVQLVGAGFGDGREPTIRNGRFHACDQRLLGFIQLVEAGFGDEANLRGLGVTEQRESDSIRFGGTMVFSPSSGL